MSVRAIAERCSVTPPAIYLHFKDKDSLFTELAARRSEDLIEQMRDAARDNDDPLDRIRACGLVYVRFGIQHPETYRVVMEPPGSQSARAVFEVLGGLVAKAKAEGAFEDDFDENAATVVLWSGVHGITSLMLSFSDLVAGDAETRAGHLLDVLIEGLLSA